MLALVFGENIPADVPEKIAFLARYRIALWDVLAACDITGASDSSIKNAKPNDIPSILKKSQIKAVFTTGKSAFRLYNQFFRDTFSDVPCFCLPSTSPANARMKLRELYGEYSKILEYL